VTYLTGTSCIVGEGKLKPKGVALVAAVALGAVGLTAALPSALAATGPPVSTSPPVITGTAVQGHTLTSTVGGWTRKPTSFVRQWYDCNTSGNACVPIPNTNTPKYILTSADVGSTIKVAVTATNSGGSATATSAPTAVVQAAATAPTNDSPPTISGTAQDGQTLTAGPGTWSGTQPLTYAYQWQRCDTSGGNCVGISGATGTTYTVASADVGHTLVVVVTASNSGGKASAPSSPTVIIQATPPALASSPTAAGTPQEGQTLTATTGTWSGTTPITYTYQWETCDPSGLDCSPINGATNSTYAVTPAEVGFTISVLVTATNSAGNASAYSAATAVVQSTSAPAQNTSPPVVTGTVAAGQQLTASSGTWTGAPPINYAYQWQGCDSNGANCVNIVGATASTYAPTSSDVGNTLAVVVTGSNNDGQSTATSVPTATVQSASTGSTTIFNDGFESGSFSAWSPGVTTGGDGTATVQGTIVKSGSFAAQLSESATSGSKAYLREGFSAQQDLTASGDFQILQQGASGSNVQFFRFFDPSGTRLVQVYRQNGTSGAIWVSYGGAFYSTTGTLALNTWANVSAHVTTNGAASTVAVTLNGRQIYQTTTASLGTAGITTLQLGNDTAAQTFNLVADNISVQTGSGSSGTPPANTAPPTVSGTAQQGQTLTATNGSWTGTAPISYAYQWQRCTSSGTNCANIAFATAATYTATSTDVGSTLRIAVTASNTAGSATGFSAPTAVVAAPSPPPGIVAQWHMNETSGTTMVDSAGAHDGALHGPVQLGLPGVSGTAFGFNGSSTYVDVPSTADLNPGSANITFTIHLQTTGTPPPAPADWDLFRKGLYTTNGAEYKMEFQQSGQASCGFEGTGGYAELAAGPAINDGQWHTISCVKTSTAIQVVVDGQVFSKAANVGSITNNSDVVIGARPGSDWYKGQLDEASIQIG
jgi:hypothetical protein